MYYTGIFFTLMHLSNLIDPLPITKLELVVDNKDVEKAVEIICDIGKTGNIGYGKIFILPVGEVIRARTCGRGKGAV